MEFVESGRAEQALWTQQPAYWADVLRRYEEAKTGLVSERLVTDMEALRAAAASYRTKAAQREALLAMVKQEREDRARAAEKAAAEREHAAQERLAGPTPEEEERYKRIERRPSGELARFLPLVDHVYRVQQLAWTAGACGIRSRMWHEQVSLSFGMLYQGELEKQSFSKDELAVVKRRAVAATRKARDEFNVDREGCIRLGRSAELADIDEARRRATLNYH